MARRQMVAQKGTVKSLRLDRGFGFVTGDDGLDRFFHSTHVTGDIPIASMQQGDRVEFVPEDSHPKGPRATAVRLA